MVSPIARIHGSRHQGLEMGVAPLSVTLWFIRKKNLLTGPMTLHSTGLDILVPEGGMLPPGGTTMISLNWNLRPLPSHFGSSGLGINRQRRKAWWWLEWLILTTKGEIGLPFYSGDSEEYIWITSDPLGVSLYYHALWLISMGHYNNPTQEGLLMVRTL